MDAESSSGRDSCTAFAREIAGDISTANKQTKTDLTLSLPQFAPTAATAVTANSSVDIAKTTARATE